MFTLRGFPAETQGQRGCSDLHLSRWSKVCETAERTVPHTKKHLELRRGKRKETKGMITDMHTYQYWGNVSFSKSSTDL